MLRRRVSGSTCDWLVERGRVIPEGAGPVNPHLGTTVCVVPQSTYLGGYTVAAAFSPADPLRFGLAVVPLAGFPCRCNRPVG